MLFRSAFNIQNVKNALNPAATTVPPGWLYDAMRDGYVNDQGLRINSLDVVTHGGVTKAIIAIHGPQALQSSTGHISQAAVQNGGFVAQSIDNLTVSNANMGITKVEPRNVIEIETKLGRVGINVETGDLTIPPGVGRNDAIREFWFGFQKHFNPFDKRSEEHTSELQSH